MGYRVLNPADGSLIVETPEPSGAEVATALASSAACAQGWALTSPAERCLVVAALEEALRARENDVALCISQTMGKPLRESRAEVEKSRSLLAWCRVVAPEALVSRDRDIGLEGGKAKVRYAPLGPVVGIMPWNFPVWQTLRFAVPTLLAGNPVILKPAPQTHPVGLLLQEVVRDAGAGEGLWQTLGASNQQVARLIEDPRVRGVSLTGSVGAGRDVGSLAGRALKRSVLELGGSDPYLVFDDANVEDAAKACVAGRFLNSGQTCIAAKRLLVHREVAPAFIDAVEAATARREVGMPDEEGTRIGPLARPDLARAIDDQWLSLAGEGARLAYEGEAPTRDEGTAWVKPRVAVLPEAAECGREEIFGPLAVIQPCASEAEMVERANQSPFGLGAAIFSSDTERAESIAGRLEAGMVAINQIVRSDPAVPFGGVKDSGVGVELGVEGFFSFAHPKVRLV